MFTCGRDDVRIVCMDEEVNFLKKFISWVGVDCMKKVKDIIYVEEEEIGRQWKTLLYS